jgi:hypothetical protein
LSPLNPLSSTFTFPHGTFSSEELVVLYLSVTSVLIFPIFITDFGVLKENGSLSSELESNPSGMETI